MKKFLFAALVFLCSIPCLATTYVAVVETISENGVIGSSEKRFLTDALRMQAKNALPAYMDYVIMTRENINAMLPPGKNIEDCEGECLVETGRNINAHYIAQARVGKFGKKLTLTVELYETKGNSLMGGFTARSEDAEGLLIEIESKAEPLFASIANGAFLQKPALGENAKDASFFENQEVDGYTTDLRDEQRYKTIKVGNIVWFAQNVNYQMGNSWCYEDKASNCKKYGRLYDWNTAKKVCPTGWRLPNNDDFEALWRAVGDKANAGYGLKARMGWDENGNGSDEIGFSVFASGFRDYTEKFDGEGRIARFWSSSESKFGGSFIWIFSYNEEKVSSDYVGTEFGYSVRCVKK